MDVATFAPLMFKIISGGHDRFTFEQVKILDKAAIMPYVDAIGISDLDDLFKNGDLIAQTKAFTTITGEADATIDLDLWMTYLESIHVLRFSYFRKMAFINDLKFVGKGLEPGKPYFSWVVEKFGVRKRA